MNLYCLFMYNNLNKILFTLKVFSRRLSGSNSQLHSPDTEFHCPSPLLLEEGSLVARLIYFKNHALVMLLSIVYYVTARGMWRVLNMSV